MFDAPGLGPFIFAPPIGIVGMVLVYILVRVVAKQSDDLAVFFSALALPLTCVASIGLGIGEASPAPWFAPTVSDVVGRWQVDENYQEYLAYYQVEIRPHELVFEADGAFHAYQIPALFTAPHSNEAEPYYLTGSGTWEFIRSQGSFRMEKMVLLNFHVLESALPTDIQAQPIKVRFEGHLPPYPLMMFGGGLLLPDFERE